MQLIIIPGSCSAKSNWFDQIHFFESAGYQVKFLDLDAHKHGTLMECSTDLFVKLKYALQSVELGAETVILAHSMGAMLLLKILSESQYYRNESPETFAKIEQAKLVFIQVPLNVNRSLLSILNVVQYILYPFFLIYHLSVFKLMEWILLTAKKFLRFIIKPLKNNFLHYLAQPVFNLFDLFLNIMLMMNAFLGSKPQEFANLINYYRQWDEFSLEGFFANKQEAMFSRAIMQQAENTLNCFDANAAKNYHFTTGSPDFFCDSILIKQFASDIGANVFHLGPGFHNPQHIFWTQEKLHKEIMR